MRPSTPMTAHDKYSKKVRDCRDEISEAKQVLMEALRKLAAIYLDENREEYAADQIKRIRALREL